MKINPPSLLQVARFTASKITHEDGEYDPDYDEYETIVRSTPCLAVIVTQENIDAAAAYREANPGNANWDIESDAEIGDVLTITRDATGQTHADRLPLIAAHDLHVSLSTDEGSRDVRIGGTGLSAAREIFNSKARTDELTATEAQVSASLLSIMRHIASAPAADVDATVLRDVYTGLITETYGDATFEVTPEEMRRCMRADTMKAAIARLAPDHADAKGVSRDIGDLLRENFVSGDMKTGAQIRAGLYNSDAMRAALAANDTLSRKVFGAMTGTRIENLGAAMIPLSDANVILDRLSDRKMEGAWIDEAKRAVGAVFQGMMPNYTFDIALINHEGNDLLVVTDNIGAGSERAYFYAWPEADRRPTMQIGDGLMATITDADIPSDEELDRLSGVLEALHAAYAARMEAIMMADDDLGDDFDEEDAFGAFMARGPRPDGA